MSLNSWDKFTKAQRDFPKPKFASSVVDKGLKKSPKNPFLLAWKAELLLATDSPKDALERLHTISALPGAINAQLLAHLYKPMAESIRKTSPDSHGLGSIGSQFLKLWQAAAKAAERKTDRLRVWDDLYNAASREDCWDDVQFAVINYQKEGISEKKQFHFLRILITHLAAEQKRGRSQKDDQMAQIQFKVARGQMKQAFQASPDYPIAVKDIRDLRFMAEIFAQQGHCTELFELWDNAPESLAAVMSTYHDELMNLKARLLRREKEWNLLETHCLKIVEDAATKSKDDSGSRKLWELSSSRWNIWDGLLDAIKQQYPQDEVVAKLEHVQRIIADVGYQSNDRPGQLTNMMLAQAMGASLLLGCKDYWKANSTIPSCFNDLRSAVQSLGIGERQEFHQFIQDQTRDTYLKEGLDQNQVPRWQQAELNVLKFDYLFTISLTPTPTSRAKDMLATKAIRFCTANPGLTEGTFVAIYTLLHLHYETAGYDQFRAGYKDVPNTRLLLQATMLARHQVACDKNKENRTLALLAARLHLNLGLGKSAFGLYNHCRVKEMLYDTLSPYVLSRISLTHPFAIKGYQGFSADEELQKVISAIDRMELTAERLICTDVSTLVYDQYQDTLNLKQKLKGSFTRQLCIIERRRIARLTGQSIDHVPRLNHGCKFVFLPLPCSGMAIRAKDRSLNPAALHPVSDNVDKSVFPSYDGAGTQGPYPLVMPNAVPSEPWMISHTANTERISNLIYREDGYTDTLSWSTGFLEDAEKTLRIDMTPAESILQALWNSLGRLMIAARKISDVAIERDVVAFPANLAIIGKAMQSLRLPESAAQGPEDEPTMFSESMLLACYSKLELLRATAKLLDLLRETVVTAKSTHSMKKAVTKAWLDNATSETQTCFNAIQDVAHSYIGAIKKRGLRSIKAQVRWGVTGETLRHFLTDADVQHYASEYVDGALEAWGGVLKVKLK